MRCLVFAYSEIGVVGIETLLDLGEEVVGIVTHKDNPGEVRWYRSVEDLARKRGILVITPDDANTLDVLAWAQEKRPDIVFSFYYRKMLKEPLLKLGKLGALNLHGSLLPKFRGRAPVNWAIIEGATQTGLTLHDMVARPDAGSIVAQEAIPITENETARELFDKLVPVARKVLATAVPLLRTGNAPRRAQNEAEATYFGARTPEDGRIDWKWPARRIHNLVRGVTLPYPGAFTVLGGRKLYIWKGAPAPGQVAGEPGKVFGDMGDGVAVVTGEGLYVVKQAGWDANDVRPAQDMLVAKKETPVLLGSL